MKFQVDTISHGGTQINSITITINNTILFVYHFRGGCRYFADGLAGSVYLREAPMVEKNSNLHAYLPVNDPFETFFWTKLTKKRRIN